MSDDIPSGGRDSRGRFTKGTSPNPDGRPKKTQVPLAPEIGVIFLRKVNATGPDGTSRALPAHHAVDLTTLKGAMDGKARAIGKVTKWVLERDRWLRKEAEKKADRSGGPDADYYSSIRSFTDPENAIEALQVLGIASRDAEYEASVDRPGYVHLRLETWAVQKALDRLRMKEPFTEREVRNIKVCTRDHETLKWPRGSRR